MTDQKPEQTQETAKANGWETALVPDLSEFDKTEEPEDIIWNLYAKRDQEVLSVTFVGNRHDSATYVYRDVHRSNPATRRKVMSILTGSPDKLDKEIRSVPFTPDAPAFEILQAVINREITWVKQVTGLEKSALVDVDLRDPASAKNCKIYTARSGRRILEWVDMIGFHAVAIADIVNVG